MTTLTNRLAAAIVLAATAAAAVVPQVAIAQSGQPGASQTREISGQRRHVVRPGDTIYSIARDAGVAVRDLLDANPRIDPRSLRVGDVLTIPARGGAVPIPGVAGVGRYVVRTGDTVASISRRFGVPLQAILALNPQIDPRFLRVGDVLRVPGRGIFRPAETIEVQPRRGGLDTIVTVTGGGFRPGERVRLLAGPGPYDLDVVDVLRAGRFGNVSAETDLPRWARPGREVYFALQTADLRARVVARPFVVQRREQPDGIVSVTGTITRSGVECPVLRGDDGVFYSLAGDLEGFRPGDRVTVAGLRAEMSICMQGTTIEIRRIRSAD